VSGPEVAPVTRLLDQPRVDRYAEAARDYNAIHRETPEAFASPFGQPIAHGMLVLALVSEAMTGAFGEAWARRGALKVRWRSPALTPVEVTAVAEFKRDRDGRLEYDVRCESPDGELLLSGTASVEANVEASA
jgi:acyl dehydratase